MISTRMIRVGIVCITVGLCSTAFGASIIWIDTEFSDPDWQHSVLYSLPSAAMSFVGQVTSGGNPGAHQEGEQLVFNPGAAILTGHLCSGCGTFDPAVSGAVANITVRFDYQDLSLGVPGAVPEQGVYLRQGSTNFIRRIDPVAIHNAWDQVSAVLLTASDPGWQIALPGALVPGTPDFSSNGQPIQLGYYAFVEATGDGGLHLWGVDNFEVTINYDCASEVCNGIDDDCDGQVDEGFGTIGLLDSGSVGFLPVGSTCYDGEGACFAPGRVICTSNGLDAYCSARLPTPGVEGPYGDPTCCNFEDDDCDGLQDGEDPDCTGAERCDFCDNDNDGLVDEDFPNLGDVCTVGVGLCKNTGVIICTDDGSGTECTAQPYPPRTEGPPQTHRCQDGLDNDCDGLIDLDDPDCLEPEVCDGIDNDGDGEIDEDFPTLGDMCQVGSGQCAASGIIVCTADGSGVMCSASPGKGSPEGPVGCDCADGIDNDCDGLIDLDDPDCGGSQLSVRCALEPTCGPLGDDCRSWHTVDFDAINGSGGEIVEAELLGLNTNGDVIASIAVADGDTVRLASRVNPADFVATTTQVTMDNTFFAGWPGCETGPGNGPLAAGCGPFDSDCDNDIDLRDFASVQVNFGQTIAYHELAAPTPLLVVQGDDGLQRAQAFCSNVPFAGMVEPDDTVVVSNEGENISRVVAALPEIDPASLFLKIDGVDIFNALGIDPAADFPGGPFGGTVQLGTSCSAKICDLRVQMAPVGTLSPNTLSMYVEDLCCGGHIAVLTGSKRPGAFPDDPDPRCNVDDLREGGVAQVFEVTIFSPTEGEITAGGPTLVTGEVCHGRELDCRFDTICPPEVKLNGAYRPLAGPIVTPGDGENSADTFRYTFTETMNQTDLVQEVILGNGVQGTLDPGANRLIAEANDPVGNAAFDNVLFAVGPVQPPGFRGATGVDKGLNLALDTPGTQQIIESLLKEMLDPLIGQVQKWLNELDGQTFEIDVPGTSCDPDITVDLDKSTIVNLDPDSFNYVITPSANQIDITITSPEASASALAKGGCRIEVCSSVFPSLCWCLVKFVISVTATVSIDGISVDMTVTEDDLLNMANIQPTLNFDSSNVNITIVGADIDAGCVGGFVIKLFQLEDDIEAILVALAQYYIDNEFDVNTLLDFVDLPALEMDLLNLSDVPLHDAMLELGFEKTDAQITASGVALAYQTTFTPTMTDSEVAITPGIPLTDAPLPQPFIPFADEIAVAISDDAVNLLLNALTRTGALITQYEDDSKTVNDLLPADCDSLLPEVDQQGACVGLRGGDCTALLPDAEDTCENIQNLAALMGIDKDTQLLLHGRIDVAPKLLLFDDPLTPSTVESALRLSQLSVGIIADRDGDGIFSMPYDTVPACSPFNPATVKECALWEACLDIDFFTDITLTMDGDVPVINTTVTNSVPSTGTMCSGGMGTPGNPFDPIAQSLVVDLLTDLVTNNTPPLRIEGLDFGGTISLQNPKLIVIENDGDTDFDDYLAITADPQ